MNKNIMLLVVTLGTVFYPKLDTTSRVAQFTLQNIDEQATIYSDIIISDVENTQSTIDEMVISEKGYVALRFNNKSINIYDDSTGYCYSIYFNRTHCGMYLEWDNNLLHIYVNSTEWQYDIQVEDKIITVYTIVDSDQSDEKWKSIYHSSGGSIQKIDEEQYTYYRTRTRCWRYNKNTCENETIVEIVSSTIKKSIPILILAIAALLTTIKIKSNDFIAKKQSNK